MKFIEKPMGSSLEHIERIESIYKVTLPIDLIEWWLESNGPIVDFGYKELQFFSAEEIAGEDIYNLKKYMPGAFPLCLDGNSNLCVARVANSKLSSIYVASCSDLAWGSSKCIAGSFTEFLHDELSPENKLNA